MTKQEHKPIAHCRRGLLVGILTVVFLTCYSRMWGDNKSPKTQIIRPFRVYKGASTHVPAPLPRERMPISRWKPYLQEVLTSFPVNFSTEFRNPCWYEGTQLQCVPYFYQLGSFKCGTTDLWDKINQHPSVLPVAKEPHWWAWRRFGYRQIPIHKEIVLKTRRKTGHADDHSVQWYFNLFRMQAVQELQKKPKLIFGDASISNLWGLGIYYWEEKFPNETNPPVYLSDLIHAVQPKAKICVILRDPVEKLWTTYMITSWKMTASPDMFHLHFKRLLKESMQCESVNSALYCAFMFGNTPDMSLTNILYHGIFYLYLREWVDVFGLENIHVIRLEDWITDPINELKSLINYLELEPLPHETLRSIVSRSTMNVNERAKLKNSTMLPSTRKEIEDFYRPWNRRLAELLKDQKYTWGY